MLNKEVCKKCTVRYGEEWWNGHSEHFWEKGYVCCVSEGVNEYNKKGRTQEINNIPDHCRYKLEHAVMEQGNESV